MPKIKLIIAVPPSIDYKKPKLLITNLQNIYTTVKKIKVCLNHRRAHT